MTLDESSVMLYCLGMSKELTVEDLDDIESKAMAASPKSYGDLYAALDRATVLALVAECRELRRLRFAMAYLRQMRVCGSDVMDPERILAWAKEYGWKEGT